MPVITAAVCTYDRYDVLEKALASLGKQTLSTDEFRIMVIDNSPDHERAADVARQYAHIPNLHYHIERTPGLSNARNVAARDCGTEFIAYMDDDAIAEPRWLEEIVAAFRAFDDKAAVVGGLVRPMWEIPRPSWLGEHLTGYVSVVDWGGELREAGESEWFAGTNITFRTAQLLEFGAFSTKLGRTGAGQTLLSNEESELVDALKAAGYRMVYQPAAAVDHLVEKKRLTRTWFRKRVAWQAASDFIMMPDECIASSREKWDSVLRYFDSLPPRERSPRALFFDTDEPGKFRWQLSAIYALTILQLAGFEGVGVD